jgi:hypothetical protein
VSGGVLTDQGSGVNIGSIFPSELIAGNEVLLFSKGNENGYSINVGDLG